MKDKASHRSLVGWMLTTVVLLALGLCGMLIGLLKAFGAVTGESIRRIRRGSSLRGSRRE